MYTVFATTSHQNQTQLSSGSKPSAEIVDGELGKIPTLLFFWGPSAIYPSFTPPTHRGKKGKWGKKGNGNSEGCHGAGLLEALEALESLGVRYKRKGLWELRRASRREYFWGLLGALTAFAYWGARVVFL